MKQGKCMVLPALFVVLAIAITAPSFGADGLMAGTAQGPRECQAGEEDVSDSEGEDLCALSAAVSWIEARIEEIGSFAIKLTENLPSDRESPSFSDTSASSERDSENRPERDDTGGIWVDNK